MDEKRIQKLLKKADRISHSSSENNVKEKIDIYHQAGEACRSIGNYDDAIKYFHLELSESQSADSHDDILYCYRFLGECYLYKNEFHTSERYHLNFLSLAKEYTNDERIEQAYTCLANTYWIWLSYLQDDILYDSESDQFPRDLCKRSLDAAKNSLLSINKLDNQLDIDIKEKHLNNTKDIQEKQQDLALRRARSYINIANAMSDIYLNDGKDHASLQTFSQYVKKAIDLSKKYNLYEELARLHSSVSCFYLAIPNYLQYKKEIITTMEQAIHYSKLANKTNEYLSCLYDIAQTLVSFDEYEEAKIYLLKIYQFKTSDNPIKEKAIQDLANVQRILTGLEDRYEKENDLRKKVYLAEKCADIYSHLDRNERSKNYYLKQLKHAQELNLDENQMATIYSSLGSIYQDLKEWQLSIDYFRREMSCRIGLGINADIEQGYSLCEIIKCEYRLKIDLNSRIRTFKRALTIARSTNEKYLIRKTVALVFAMKVREPQIRLNDDLEEFMANIQPPITEENYSEILRCSESIENEQISHHVECKLEQFIIEGDDTDCHNWTSLHKAVSSGNIDLVRYLLDHKANINARTNSGLTALIIACYNGCLDIIEILLTYGARINLRTNNGYTAVDYLEDYDETMSSDDYRKLNRLKELLLVAMRKDEPIYCTQRILRSDFDREEIVLPEMNNSSCDRNIRKDRRISRKKEKNKFAISKINKREIDDEDWIVDDSEPIETISKRQKERLHSPARKRRCTMVDNEPSLSNDIEFLNIDDYGFLIPFQKESSVPSFQIMTPKSTMRSRQASTASSINTTIVLSPPISHDTNTRIIRCLANTSDRLTEDKRLRIPIAPTDTITNLRYQVLKRLYDNYNIYAYFVTLYDSQDWELGVSENDTIQLAIPIDDSDIKAIYIEKDPIILYEQICKDMCLVVYSNIRSVLKQFFDKYELSLQRLSLKCEQAISILKVFENCMFIYSINLSENNLTDEIFDQLEKLTLNHLKTLNLSKNKFTSNGIKKLFEQKSMNNLLILDLISNIDIDCITLIFLQNRFPNLTIYH